MDGNEFMAWVRDHFDIAEGAIRCRRCGRKVRYLTKHAAVVHGDDVEVMPARRYAKSW